MNPKNKDLECFKWAATLAVVTKPEGKNKERISKELKRNSEELNWYGLTFPVELSDIDIFEENNPNVSVNVFGYNEIKEEVYPLRISKQMVKELIFFLFQILIKIIIVGLEICLDFLLRRLIIIQHKRFICLRCLNSFPKQESLDKHEEYCKDKSAVKINMPSKGSKLKFKNYHHSMRVPFVIYADFECITEKIESSMEDNDHSWTNKFQRHKPSGFCYAVKSTVEDLFPLDVESYTSSDPDEDIGQIFVDSIENKVREIYNKIWHKKVELTEEDDENYKSATDCHICCPFLLTEIRF